MSKGVYMKKHNWFGLIGVIAIICVPIAILRDTIHDILN